MRGTRLAMIVLACAAVAACEDGPNQTFVPPPPGAGNTWNNGWDPGANPPLGTSDSVDAGYVDVADAGYAGNWATQGDDTNLFYPCSGAVKQSTWANMVTQPIAANAGGGLNMAGVDSSGNVNWTGETIEQAIAQLCQADNLNGYFGSGSFDDGWGDGDIVVADYNQTNRYIDIITINGGYLGNMTVTDLDCTFADVCGSAGVPCNVTWTANEIGQLEKQVAHGNYPQNTPAPWSSQSAAQQKVIFIWDGGQQDQDQWASFYNGMVNAYVPVLIPSGFPGYVPGSSCFNTGQCLTNAFGNSPYFYAPGFGVGIIFGPTTAAQPVPSIPQQFQMYFTKFMPYSFLNPSLALNGTGPTAVGAVGSLTPQANCPLGFGLPYGVSGMMNTFLGGCVDVDTTGAQDMIEQQKLLEGLTHDDQTYTFDLQGVDVNFFAATLAPTAVVEDGVAPKATDYDGYFNVDQSTQGLILNDYTAACSGGSGGSGGSAAPCAEDLHGTGAVYQEYQRLVITTLRQEAGYTAGNYDDSKCLYPAGSPPSNPAAWVASLPGYCTGFEGMITPAAPTSATDLTNIGDPNWTDAVGQNLASIPPFDIGGLRPGTPNVYFCFDPGGAANAESLVLDEYPSLAQELGQTGSPNIPFSGFTNCYPPPGNFGDTQVEQPALFSASAARAKQVFGKGIVSNLPLDAQDYRFFFKQFGIALLKYLMASDQSGAPLTNGTCTGTGTSTCTDGLSCVLGLCTVPIEYNDLFFDSLGDGQFENMEYVDRRFTNAVCTTPPCSGGVPLDFVLTCDVRDGILNSYDFYHELYRGENLMYAAIRQTPSDNLGAESNALLSNIFGSPVLQGALQASPATGLPYWQDTTDPNSGSVVHTAYQCATQNLTAAANPADTAPCVHPPPLNPDGTIILNADGQPLLAPYEPLLSNTLTPSVFALGKSQLQEVQTYPQITDAVISVPLLNNPFDPTSGPVADGTVITTDSGPLTVSGGAIQSLINWLPPQPSVGVDIPLSAVSDKLIESSMADFTGVTVTAQIFYNNYSAGTCKKSGATCATNADCTMAGDSCEAQNFMDLLEVNSSDFLGDVFLCQDPLTGDLLSARMYTSVNTIMDWIGKHPSTYDSCGLLVRYSPFNNYVTFITSTVNGVGIDTTQGGGGGRVVGAVLFVPGQ